MKTSLHFTIRTGEPARSRCGFTLIELLVVIAIIALLAVLLLPALVRAKDFAKSAASSSIKDVAGNALTGTLSRSSTGTKRVIAINGGSPYGTQGLGTYYAPQFVSDNGFQGNEPYPVLTLTSGMNAQYWFDSSVDLSGVVNPAPEAGYQTSRVIYYEYYGQLITYSIPVESGSYTLRLHFCQNYFNNIGDEKFDIYVNGSAQWYLFDILAQTGGQMHKAYIAERNNVSPVNGTITVTLDPRTGHYGDNASICGIEIVKP